MKSLKRVQGRPEEYNCLVLSADCLRTLNGNPCMIRSHALKLLNLSVSILSSTSAPLAVFILPFMALWHERHFAESWQNPGFGSNRRARKSKGATITQSLLFDISTSVKYGLLLQRAAENSLIYNVLPGYTADSCVIRNRTFITAYKESSSYATAHTFILWIIKLTLN